MRRNQRLTDLLNYYLHTAETREARRAWLEIIRLLESERVSYEVMIENLRQDAELGRFVDILPPSPDDLED